MLNNRKMIDQIGAISALDKLLQHIDPKYAAGAMAEVSIQQGFDMYLTALKEVLSQIDYAASHGRCEITLQYSHADYSLLLVVTAVLQKMGYTIELNGPGYVSTVHWGAQTAKCFLSNPAE